MITAYLDTNIFGDFADGAIPQDQWDTLRKAVAQGKIRVVYSMALMDEQATHCTTKSWGKRAVQLAREVCSHQGVKFHVHILKDEILAVFKGHQPPGIFMPTGSYDDKEYDQLWKQLAANSKDLDLGDWAALEKQHHGDFNVGMKDAKEEIERLRAQGGKSEMLPFRAWRAEQFANEFANGAVYQLLAKTALRYAGKHPRKWKTLLRRIDHATATRMYLDIHLAYSYALLIEKTSTKRPFSKDLLHALYASRTDLLVTNDQQFRKVFSLIPRNKRPPVHSWDTFRENVLSQFR